MKLLVLAAVVGAVLAVGLYSTSASADSGITTTVGDESNAMVASYGPLMNAVNHLCPDGQMLTTGHLSKDDPLLDLCKLVGAHFSGLKGTITGSFTGLSMPSLERKECNPTGDVQYD